MYNGYTNYETWVVCLWLHNEYNSQKHYEERTEHLLDYTNGDKMEAKYLLANEIKEEFFSLTPYLSKASVWSDLISHAIEMVNWTEVAESFIES